MHRLIPRLALVLPLLSPAVSAGNGAVTYAQPATGIVADGSLDDWPAEPRLGTLGLSYWGNPPSDPSDLDVQFRVAFEEGGSMLWVAVEVEDESHQVEEEGRAWWDDDSCVLYLDKTHSPAGSGPIAYALAGSRRELSGDSGIPWDPVVAAGGWQDGTGAMVREGTRTVYEFALDTGRELSAGQVLGFDLVVIDLDEGDEESDGSFVCWGEGLFKNRNAGRCGAVVLMGDGAPLAKLTGSVRWDSAGDLPRPKTVRITSRTDARRWLDVAIDESRTFAVDLPAGEYTVTPTQWILEGEVDLVRIADGASVTLQLEAGTETQADPLVLSVAPEPDLLNAEVLAQGFDVAFFDRYLDAWMQYYCITGATVSVVRDGELAHARHAGVQNALTGAPITDETLFEAASITKAIFAFAVLRLVEKGTVELDRPLYLDLPFPALTHDERHKLLTPRVVLTHRSGLPNWRSGGEGDPIEFRFTPDTEYGYSGEAFQYLARVVAKLDGRSIDEILQQEALEPMGMGGATCFHDSPELRATAARGHRLAGPTRGNLPAETGVAHSMYSNTAELTAFLIGLLKGEGLDAATYDELLRFRTERPQGEIAPEVPWRKGFGLGYMLMESPHGLVFGHDGNNGDFRSNMEGYRELNGGFVVFVNHSLGGLLANRLRRYVLPALGEGARRGPSGR